MPISTPDSQDNTLQNPLSSSADTETTTPTPPPTPQAAPSPSTAPPPSPLAALHQRITDFVDGSAFEEEKKITNDRTPAVAFSDFLVTFVFNTGTMDEILNDPNTAFLLNQPDSPAFLRDLARIAKQRGMADPTSRLPQVENDIFEDPYNLGTKYLKKIVELDREKSVKSDLPKKLTSAVTPESFVDIKGTSDADFLASHIVVALITNDQTSPKQFINFWNKYKKAFQANLPPASVAHLLTFFGKKLEDKDKTAMSQDVLDFVSKNGNHQFLKTLWPIYGPHLFYLLKQDKYLTVLIDLVKSDEQDTKAFALYAISLLIIEDPAIMNKIATGLFAEYNDWKNPEMTELFQLIETLPGIRPADKKQLTSALLESADALLYKFITDKGYLDYQNLFDQLHETFPVCALMDKPTAEAIIKSKIAPKTAGSSYFASLCNVPLPADFDPNNAVMDMLTKTSLPLIEKRHLVDKETIPKRFVIIIEPKPGNVDALATFRLQICYYTLKKNQLTAECATFDFDRGQLITDVPAVNKKQIEKLGLYLAHQYFVRKQVNAPKPKTSTLAQAPEENIPQPDQYPADTANPTPEPPPEETPASEQPRPYTERTAAPLKVSFKKASLKQITTIRKTITKTLSANKEMIKKLLAGNLEGIDINKVIIHRQATEVIDGKETLVYERVPALEILEAVIDGTLNEKPYFVLGNLPHMKSLGYTKSIHWVEKITFNEADSFNIPQEIWEEIWEVDLGNELLKFRDSTFNRLHKHLSRLPLTANEINAIIQLWNRCQPSANGSFFWRVKPQEASRRAVRAYDLYLKAGFPPLSDFRRIEAQINIETQTQRIARPVTVTYEQPTGEKIQFTARQVSQTVAGTLAEKIIDPPKDENEYLKTLQNLLTESHNWLDDFINKQKTVYEEEIREILASPLPVEEKEKLIEELRLKISELPELRENMQKDATIMSQPSANGPEELARLSLGWVPTETTFNSGQFVEIQKL